MSSPVTKTALRLAVPAVLLATAGLLSACDTGRPAATVGGTSIAASDVFADLEAEAAASDPADTGSSSGNPLAFPTEGQPASSYRATSAAAALTNRVYDAVVANELDRLGEEVTEADREASRQAVCSTTDPQTGQATPPSGDTCPRLDAYPDDYAQSILDRQAHLRAMQRVLQARVDQDREALYAQVAKDDPDALVSQICYRAVLASDESVARRLAEAADGDAVLAEVAASAPDVQIAPSDDCQPMSAWQDPVVAGVVDVPEGGTFGPLPGSGGFVVLEVVDRVSMGVDDPEVNQVLVRAEVRKLLEEADIEVDPRFGRWDTKTQAVVGGEPATLPEQQSTTVPPGALTSATGGG